MFLYLIYCLLGLSCPTDFHSLNSTTEILKTTKSRLSCLTCYDLWHKNKLHIDVICRTLKIKMEGLRSESFSSWPSLFFTALFLLCFWVVFAFLLVQVLSWLEPDLYISLTQNLEQIWVISFGKLWFRFWVCLNLQFLS